MTNRPFTEFVTARLLGYRGDRLRVWREAEEAFPLQPGVWSRVCRIARTIEADNCEVGEQEPPVNHPITPGLMVLPTRATTPSRKPATKRRRK